MGEEYEEMVSPGTTPDDLCADAPSALAPTAEPRAKHTAGPWEVRWRFGRATTVSGRQHYPICDTGTAPIAEANHAREEANARLIAAAPDLLEALQWVMSAHGEQLQDAFDAAHRAIAKATGDQSGCEAADAAWQLREDH